MSGAEPPGKDWWQASDGQWYPPETHPTFWPPEPETEPIAQPSDPAELYPAAAAAAQATAPSTRLRPWRPAVITVIGLLVLVGSVVGFFGLGRSESSGTSPVKPVPTLPLPQPLVPTPAAPTAVPQETNDLDDVAQLLAYDAVVPIDFGDFPRVDPSVWNVRVGPPADYTSALLAQSSLNEAPPDGVIYLAFDVDMTLVSAPQQPFAPEVTFGWEVWGGATRTVYERDTINGLLGCGSVANKLDPFASVFTGGSLSGLVCIPVPVEDFESPDTRVAMNVRGERIVFAADGDRPDPAAIDEPDGLWQQSTIGYDIAAPIQLGAGSGDAAGSQWNIAVAVPRDVEAEIAEDNPFNNPSPDTVSYLGFDVEMTLAAASVEPLSAGGVTWEIFGGASRRVYEVRTLALTGCGSWSQSFRNFEEAFLGGTISGVVCIPVPNEDVDHPDTAVSINLGGERTVFSATGETAEARQVEEGVGPAGIGEGAALGTTIEAEWDTFDEADGSRWSVTVTNWRDITSDVLDENPFNEPPAAGQIMVGIDVETTLHEADTQPLAPGINLDWEVLGGETRRVYTVQSFRSGAGCGVVPESIDRRAEVLVGGTLQGTFCMLIPESDYVNAETRIALNISDERFTFDPTQ